MTRPSRLPHLLLLLLVLSSAGLGLLRFNAVQTGASYDDAHYVILARSLAEGRGYQLINFPHPQAEHAFPPGWPLLLTPLSFLAPANLTILKLFTLLIWLVCLPLLLHLFRSRIDSPYLEMLLALTAFNALLTGASVTLMSETAFLFFSLAALLLFENSEGRPVLLLLAALAAFYSQLTRTIGISLCAAMILFLLAKRRFRDAALAGGVFAAGALVQFWINRGSGGALVSAGYESQVLTGSLLEKAGQMFSNLQGYLDQVAAGALLPLFGARFNSLAGPVLPMIINALVLLLVLLGFGLSVRKPRLMDLYALIYLAGVLAFWNPKVGSVKVRFLLPLIPFAYFHLVQALKWISEKVSKVHAARISAAAAALIVLVSLVRTYQDWRSPVSAQTTDLSIGASWIAAHAPPDAIVMVNEPVPSYVQMFRRTVGYPASPSNLEGYLANQGVDYILVAPLLQTPRSKKLDPAVESQVLPQLEGDPQHYQLVFQDKKNNVSVYEVLP